MNTQEQINANPVKVLAQSIREIADAAQAIRAAGLKRRTLVVLLQDRTGLPQRDINNVLDGLEEMKSDWLS